MTYNFILGQFYLFVGFAEKITLHWSIVCTRNRSEGFKSIFTLMISYVKIIEIINFIFYYNLIYLRFRT